jgi:hypothetical protein
VRCPRCGGPAKPSGAFWFECAGTCTRAIATGPLPLPADLQAERAPFVFLIDDDGTPLDPFTLAPIDPAAN